MLKIEVKSVALDEFSGISKKSGQPFKMKNQTAYVQLMDVNGEILRQSLKITLQDGQQPYPVGLYQLAPSSIMVDSFSRLVIGRVVLQPLQSAVRQAA